MSPQFCFMLQYYADDVGVTKHVKRKYEIQIACKTFALVQKKGIMLVTL